MLSLTRLTRYPHAEYSSYVMGFDNRVGFRCHEVDSTGPLLSYNTPVRPRRARSHTSSGLGGITVLCIRMAGRAHRKVKHRMEWLGSRMCMSRVGKIKLMSILNVVNKAEVILQPRAKPLA